MLRQSVGKSLSGSVSQSFGKSVSVFVSQSVGKSVGGSVSHLMVSQSVALSVSQLVSQSVAQSVGKSVSCSVRQSASWLVSQSVALSVSQSVVLSDSQSVTLSESVSQWSVTWTVSQSDNQPVHHSPTPSVNFSINQYQSVYIFITVGVCRSLGMRGTDSVLGSSSEIDW